MTTFTFSIGTSSTKGQVKVETEKKEEFEELIKFCKRLYQGYVEIPKIQRELNQP